MSKKMTPEQKARKRETDFLWKQKNREHIKKTNLDYNKKHAAEKKAYDIRYQWQNKAKLMNKYGGQCQICSCKEIALLTIDHIDGGGKTERDSDRDSGINYYAKLLKQPIRSDLRCLCITCNWKARMYGSNPKDWDKKRLEIEHLANLSIENRIKIEGNIC